jgi:flotillin
MAKKKSFIEMQSRVEVAANMQKAETAEIEARQAVGIRQQEAAQAVNIKTAEQQRASEVATQQAQQSIAEEKAKTAAKNMEIANVNNVRAAEIEKAVQVVKAEQDKQVAITQAEGQKAQTILVADGNLEAKKREAEAIRIKGESEGSAKYALEVAPVNAQIVLSKEIGQNKEYQNYLVTIRGLEKDQAIGVAQATALSQAEVKVIANTGDRISNGLTSAMDLFSAKGGTAIASALEAMAQTPAGEAIVNRISGKSNGNGADIH